MSPETSLRNTNFEVKNLKKTVSLFSMPYNLKQTELAFLMSPSHQKLNFLWPNDIDDIDID